MHTAGTLASAVRHFVVQTPVSQDMAVRQLDVRVLSSLLQPGVPRDFTISTPVAR